MRPVEPPITQRSPGSSSCRASGSTSPLGELPTSPCYLIKDAKTFTCFNCQRTSAARSRACDAAAAADIVCNTGNSYRKTRDDKRYPFEQHCPPQRHSERHDVCLFASAAMSSLPWWS